MGNSNNEGKSVSQLLLKIDDLEYKLQQLVNKINEIEDKLK